MYVESNVILVQVSIRMGNLPVLIADLIQQPIRHLWKDFCSQKSTKS